MARFLRVDLVDVGDDGGNFNRYWYANNNPYKYIDPDGRFAWIAIGAGVGAIVGGAAYLLTISNPTGGGLATSIGTGAVVGEVTTAFPFAGSS